MLGIPPVLTALTLYSPDRDPARRVLFSVFTFPVRVAGSWCEKNPEKCSKKIYDCFRLYLYYTPGTGPPMISVVFAIIALVALVILISLAWRIASRHVSLPCPVWMKWLLDPPSFSGVSARTQKTLELLAIRSGMNVLDAGLRSRSLTGQDRMVR
jgi:hypothetical protein